MTLVCGTHYGIGMNCLTEAGDESRRRGEQKIDWVPEKN